MLLSYGLFYFYTNFLKMSSNMFIASLPGLRSIYSISGLLQSMGLEEMEALSKRAKLWPHKTIFPNAPSEYYAYKFGIILDAAAKSPDLKEIFVFNQSGINSLYSITEEDINAFADYFDLRNVATVIDCREKRNNSHVVTLENLEIYRDSIKDRKDSDLIRVSFILDDSNVHHTYMIEKEEINFFARNFLYKEIHTPINCNMLRNKALNITQDQWDTYQKGLKELVISKRKVPDHIIRRLRTEQRAADRAAIEGLERGYFARPESDVDFVDCSDEPNPDPKESFRKPAVKTAEDRLVYRDRSGSGSSRQQLRNDAKLVGKLLSNSI